MKTVWVDDDNKVFQVSLGTPTGDPPAGLRWFVVENSVKVGIGYTVDKDGTFTPPEQVRAPRYADATAAVSGLSAGIDLVLNQVTGSVPEAERLSWGTKEQAARAFMAGTAQPYDTSMLVAEATARGAQVAEVAGKIVAKANAYRLLISTASGIRQAAEDALTATDDPAEYEKIVDAALQKLRIAAGVPQ
jgi:hypothetical protein